MENFRWNKVIICTDADVDGFQIRTLVLTMLYRLTPTLIEEGCVSGCKAGKMKGNLFK